jgi:hypothetical protein
MEEGPSGPPVLPDPLFDRTHGRPASLAPPSGRESPPSLANQPGRATGNKKRGRIRSAPVDFGPPVRPLAPPYHWNRAPRRICRGV